MTRHDLKLFGMEAAKGRWVFVAIGLLINVCLGSIYAFSVFRKPLEVLWGISSSQSGYPFMVFLAVFAVAMPLAGSLIERWGPRLTATLGGLLAGTGWIAASFSVDIATLTLLYGVIGGAGVGIVYGCPIAVVVKWFPRHSGLAIGLTVMGFGVSALLIAPLMKAMILLPEIGIMHTFLYLGIAFTIVIALLAQLLRFPSDARNPTASATLTAAPVPPALNLNRQAMLKTRRFYALWATYTIGCLAGLMAIGIASPVGTEVAQLDAPTAALAVSLFAVFNGLGRPLFGALTDKLGPKHTAIVSFTLILSASLLLFFFGQGNAMLYLVAFCVLWMCLGGWLALAPTATGIFFGKLHYAQNYGVMFTAYGAGAILGTLLSGSIKDITGSYLHAFAIVAGLAVLGMLIAAMGLNAPDKRTT
ncbi:L-lactate MFS transporter [Nitrosomonas oligotropha]|uniref:Sugar phosphate permease n=1 Tax=Nitrosomonas oligotropha TaxID=42354 RepID=A0A1H8V477_9PROT|nr:OFA family MFS transporter [Nitrosomonas oligotropha]SDX52545.1 Sugar phosphate permease [Nitrosomonas oligotropha]SEP10225.1 Sugar phosphate permease [Nitrosomonas oligotropha]